jgi:hypothetical protein
MQPMPPRVAALCPPTRALELREEDKPTLELMAARLESWRNMNIMHRGRRPTIDGVGFSAIARVQLRLRQQRARCRFELAFGGPGDLLATLFGLRLATSERARFGRIGGDRLRQRHAAEQGACGSVDGN